VDFREVILERLRGANVSRYKLARRLRDTISQRALYDYLGGKTETSTAVLAAIFEALKIQVVPDRNPDWFWYEWLRWEQSRADSRKPYRRRRPRPKGAAN
jgi:hypothetical protein